MCIDDKDTGGNSVTDLDPVMLGEPLWTLRKGKHTAEARVRALDSIGLELRYEWNGDLRASQVFKAWAELEQAADEKRRELEARGLADVSDPSIPPAIVGNLTSEGRER
jgi:hypothetical protein